MKRIIRMIRAGMPFRFDGRKIIPGFHRKIASLNEADAVSAVDAVLTRMGKADPIDSYDIAVDIVNDSIRKAQDFMHSMGLSPIQDDFRIVDDQFLFLVYYFRPFTAAQRDDLIRRAYSNDDGVLRFSDSLFVDVITSRFTYGVEF